jgi:hypothetical protein
MAAIVVSDLVLPQGVEVKVMKTATSFTRGSKKAYLKGSNLEITNPTKELGKRVKAYAAEIIEKCHLGAVKAAIPAVEDTVDLQKIINRYFKK